MTLVEDCTLRLDDPVDALLPELAAMAVLADPNGPLDDTVPANRPITLRDLLTYTLGAGMTVGAASATAPISDALGALQRPPLGAFQSSPDEWIRRLGALPVDTQLASPDTIESTPVPSRVDAPHSRFALERAQTPRAPPRA